MSDDRTILISTHQVKDVENLIDPIIIVDAGKVVFNQSIFDVSNKLILEKVHELSGDELYSQEVLGGFQIVRRNTQGIEGPVDLELLFNAVVSKGSSLDSVFSSEVVDE